MKLSDLNLPDYPIYNLRNVDKNLSILDAIRSTPKSIKDLVIAYRFISFKYMPIVINKLPVNMFAIPSLTVPEKNYFCFLRFESNSFQASCSCEFFKYYCEYTLERYNSSFTKHLFGTRFALHGNRIALNKRPTVKNKELRVMLCKHLVISTNYYFMRISK